MTHELHSFFQPLGLVSKGWIIVRTWFLIQILLHVLSVLLNIFSIPHLSVSESSPPPPHLRQSVSPGPGLSNVSNVSNVKSEPMSPRHQSTDVHHLVRNHVNHLSPASINAGKRNKIFVSVKLQNSKQNLINSSYFFCIVRISRMYIIVKQRLGSILGWDNWVVDIM